MESRRPPEQEISLLYGVHVRRLTAIAFNIIGEWQTAEDIAEEAFARLLTHSPDDPLAWLTTVTTRLALDYATSAAHMRTEYIGPWLPEIAAGEQHFPDVDLALARLLQTLSPVDRAAIVLADVADFSTSEIAAMLKSTPAGARKRLSRARARLREVKGSAGSTTEASPDVVEELAQLLHRGELELFITRISDNAVLWVDSGGTASAARNPIVGKSKIHRFLNGLFAKFGTPEFRVASHNAGMMIVAESTDMTRWVILETLDGDEHITSIQVQQNASKRKELP